MIHARGLARTFHTRQGNVDAVRGVDLNVDAGEIVGFLGPNGAGKTTTLRMLTTLLTPTSGEATVAGIDLRRDPAGVRRRIGYVAQSGSTAGAARAGEEVVDHALLYGVPRSAAVTRGRQLFDQLELDGLWDRKCSTLSGGQRRRLDIALGIVHGPEVLFLDEPTTGLDPQNRANLWEHIRLLQERGTTVFLTTHYLEEADALCDRLVIMDHGQVVVEGTPRELKHQVAGDSVVLMFREHSPESVAAIVTDEPYVRETSVEDDTTLRLYVEDGATALPLLLRKLDSAHVTLASMSLSEPTLDDVFLHQTGRSLRDTGDSGAGSRRAA